MKMQQHKAFPAKIFIFFRGVSPLDAFVFMTSTKTNPLSTILDPPLIMEMILPANHMTGAKTVLAKQSLGWY